MPDPRAGIPWGYLAIFLVAAIAVGLWTWHHVQRDRQSALDHWSARIATIAEDRARLVADWLGAHRADAEVLAAHPAVRAILAGATRGDESLVSHLNRVTAAYGYAGVWLFDRRGRVAAQSSGATAAGGAPATAVTAVLSRREPVIDLVEGEGGRRLLTVSVPVPTAGAPAAPRPPLGVVTLVIRPEAALFPLLADESAVSRTGETLLFRADGDEPAYSRRSGQAAAGWAALTRVARRARRGAARRRTAAPRWASSTTTAAVPVLAAIRRVARARRGRSCSRSTATRRWPTSCARGGSPARPPPSCCWPSAASSSRLWRERERAPARCATRCAQERAMFDLTSYAEKMVGSVPVGPPACSRPTCTCSPPTGPSSSPSGSRTSDVVGRPSTT